MSRGLEWFSLSWLPRLAPGWILALSLLLLPFQITNQSLSMDEGDTALYALQPNLTAWFTHLHQDRLADSQMPLSMWFAWAGGKLFGVAEWEMRLVNLFWAGGTLLAMFHAGRVLKCKWLPALMVIQPYFWFYNNEARPYSFQLFCGSLLLLGWVLLYRDQTAKLNGNDRGAWAWILAAGAVALGYATLLALFTFIALAALAATAVWLRGWRFQRQDRIALLVAGALLAPIAAYYGVTLIEGRILPVLWKSDWKNFFYLGYELTGLSGLGPSLLVLREASQGGALPAILRRHAPELLSVAAAGTCWAVLLGIGLRKLVHQRRWLFLAGLLAVPLLGGGLMTLFGIAMKKVFWARHWAPLFPFYVGAMGLVLKAAFTSDEKSTHDRLPAFTYLVRALAACWVTLLMLSALSFRFADKHRKDDYRAAAGLAKQYLNQGKPVSWAASWHCGVYYQLPIGSIQEKALGIRPGGYPIEPTPNNSSPAAGPPIIFLSRPSIYDSTGFIRDYAGEHHMTCEEGRYRSFRIYFPHP